MNLQEQIMEQATAINNVASSAYKEGYKRGYEDAKKEHFFDNADRARDIEKDQEAMGDIVKPQEAEADGLIKISDE